MRLILFTTILVVALVTITSASVPPKTIDERIKEAAEAASKNEVHDSDNVNTKPELKQSDIAIPADSPGSRRKRQAIDGDLRRWPDKKVPYVIQSPSQFSSAELSMFQQAVDEYNRLTCIRLVPRTTETKYVLIVREGGCWSYVGLLYWQNFQKMSLSEGCLEDIGTPIHEFLHALGVHHTQSRPDRDNYVDIIWSNIISGKEGNFLKESESLTYGLPYDYRSVMHYGSNYFGINGAMTIRTKDSSYQNVIGRAATFSSIDIQQLHEMYGCSTVNPQTTARPPPPPPPGPETTAEPEPENQCTEIKKVCGCTLFGNNNCGMLENTKCNRFKGFCKCEEGYTPKSDGSGCDPLGECTEVKEPCGCNMPETGHNCDMLENTKCNEKKGVCVCENRKFKPKSDGSGCEIPECTTVGYKTCICEEGEMCAGIENTVCKKRPVGFKCKCRPKMVFVNGRCQCKPGYEFRNGRCRSL